MEERFLNPATDSDREAETLVEPPPEQRHRTEIYRLQDQFDHLPLFAPPPPKTSGKRVFLHLFLFFAAMVTTTLAGYFTFIEEHSLKSGLMYSFTLLTILTAHEMGHYIACRWYGVEATLPYFIPFVIPVPVLQVGTFGAFIKIKSPIPSRRALFDIGIAGPLAGFVFAVPAAFIAHYYAQPSTFVEGDGFLTLQDPLLFVFFHKLLNLPSDLLLNPVMFAAWVGLLVTAMNLMPVGQLDGGHVTYALFGKRGHRSVAAACYAGVIVLVAYSIYNQLWTYILYAVILTLMMRVGHPPVVEEEEALGAPRIIVALIGLLVFILCFMPFPFQM